MLFISPPFGNYISLPKTTSIRGSFTLQNNPGLLYKIITTLRYSPEMKGWVNKIGLRNKGIDYAIETHKPGDIESIAILSSKEIPILNEKIPKDMDLEINVSCPNAEKKMISKNLECFLNPSRKWCIIKLSPYTTLSEVNQFYQQGFRQFHCSNTIPTPHGGVSGPIIKPYTVKLINQIQHYYPNTIVIAGGGIRSIDDIKHYQKCGANHFSISTLCFNPILFSLFYVKYLNH